MLERKGEAAAGQTKKERGREREESDVEASRAEPQGNANQILMMLQAQTTQTHRRLATNRGTTWATTWWTMPRHANITVTAAQLRRRPRQKSTYIIRIEHAI